MVIIREYLKALRLKNNLTQAEVASRLGICNSCYSLIENGYRQKNMDIVLVAKLADVFGISIAHIVDSEIKIIKGGGKN